MQRGSPLESSRRSRVYSQWRKHTDDIIRLDTYTSIRKMREAPLRQPSSLETLEQSVLLGEAPREKQAAGR